MTWTATFGHVEAYGENFSGDNPRLTVDHERRWLKVTVGNDNLGYYWFETDKPPTFESTAQGFQIKHDQLVLLFR